MSQAPINQLIELMQQLRDPINGCPWDQKQTFKTIAPHTIEEAYEVADAIDRENFDDLKDELADLLFQVIFYAQMAKESGIFELNDIIQHLNKKLIRRHPHVFQADGKPIDSPTTMNEEQIKANWEIIKQQERAGQPGQDTTSVLDTVPNNLPSLSKAYKLQKLAASQQFDWPSYTPVRAKLNEELAELEQAIEQQQANKIEAEMGDVLFTCVNMARHLKINPEQALNVTNQTFTKRFRYVEQQINRLDLDSLDEEEKMQRLDQLWQAAKNNED